jgi:hypothetical protein
LVLFLVFLPLYFYKCQLFLSMDYLKVKVTITRICYTNKCVMIAPYGFLSILEYLQIYRKV